VQRHLPTDGSVNAMSAARTVATFDPTPTSASRRGIVRFLSGVAVAAMTGLVLTGCGGDEDGDDEDEDDD
jgi:hypothetical protein